METFTAAALRQMPAPTIQRLIREAGWTQRDVGLTKNPPVTHVMVGLVIRKKTTSIPVWQHLAWCLNHPRNGRAL